ncbi:MAG: hypothetical protein Q9157_000785 [Trypethelium eluteriae]
MEPAPLVVLNGYPGVGKAAVASALQKLIPNSKCLDNHLLIDPVAALLEREDAGYRDLRKALVCISFYYDLESKDSLMLKHFLFQRDPIFDCIATNPSLRPRTVITTYYQETFADRAIDLEECLHSARRGGRLLIVFILTCSKEENMRRLLDKSRESKSKLRDIKILEDILENHFVYSFDKAGFKPPTVWEYSLDITSLDPQGAALVILDIVKEHEKAFNTRADVIRKGRNASRLSS